MKKVCVFLAIIIAVTFSASGQLLVFAGGQNTECHEERVEEWSRTGNKEAGGEEEQKRDQVKDPE